MVVPARPVSGAPIETAWGDIVHDGYVAQDVQSGTIVAAVTATARYDKLVPFPRAFAAPPIVVAMAYGGNTNMLGGVTLPTTADVMVGVFRRDGANLTPGNVTIHWVAIGPRA